MLWGRTYGFSSLFKKTRKSNRLQMSLQRQNFSVILSPWVLVWPGFKPATSCPADQHSPNWANQATVKLTNLHFAFSVLFGLIYSETHNFVCEFFPMNIQLINYNHCLTVGHPNSVLLARLANIKFGTNDPNAHKFMKMYCNYPVIYVAKIQSVMKLCTADNWTTT